MALRASRSPPMARQQDDLQLRGQDGKDPQGFQPVHAHHLQVQQSHVENVFFQQPHRIRPALGRGRQHAAQGQPLGEHTQVRGFIVHQQHAYGGLPVGHGDILCFAWSNSLHPPTFPEKTGHVHPVCVFVGQGGVLCAEASIFRAEIFYCLAAQTVAGLAAIRG